ncbi:MAG: tRNA lysidine(34) synthetase TilS [Deltaproteobacteria bacterium]|nr:tRNA lysidine(34) synthetase TilS [Deltaproteobacteria bacterium]
MDDAPPNHPWRLCSGPVLRRCADKVAADVRAHALWRRGDTVGWAVSGGLDSLCGMRLLCALRRRLGHRLVALHVDHGVAPTRAHAEALVAAACADLGLPLHVARVSVPRGPDWEARARHARYAALADLGDRAGCQVVATGHHADDQAETLLLRLCRGAGMDALAGILTARGDGVVRPLLGLTRATLRDLHGSLPWWSDPGNDDLHPARNRVRHLALPALVAAEPDAVAGLCRSAQALALGRNGARTWMGAALAGGWHRDGEALVVERPRVPADRGAWSELLRWAAETLGAPLPTVRATRQFFAVAALGDGRSCRLRGLWVSVTADRYRFECAPQQ